jgi:hypothetical protein
VLENKSRKVAGRNLILERRSIMKWTQQGKNTNKDSFKTHKLKIGETHKLKIGAWDQIWTTCQVFENEKVSQNETNIFL